MAKMLGRHDNRAMTWSEDFVGGTHRSRRTRRLRTRIAKRLDQRVAARDIRDQRAA